MPTPRHGLSFLRILPARYPASRLTRLNRVFFHSTIRSAPVPPVMDWGSAVISTRCWSCRIHARHCAAGPWHPGPPAVRVITSRHWNHLPDSSISRSTCPLESWIPKSGQSSCTGPARSPSPWNLMMVCGPTRPSVLSKASCRTLLAAIARRIHPGYARSWKSSGPITLARPVAGNG